jgi:hypothetical protein
MSPARSDFEAKRESAWSLWVAVGTLFGLMAIAWFILFSLAADNPVESVPLEHTTEP